MAFYLIQGFFFQNQHRFDIGVRSNDEQPAVIIRSGLCRFIYPGIIFLERDNLAGRMTDQFGESTPFKMHISPNEVGFAKKYEQRQDIINYKFVLQNGLWVGGYSGPMVREVCAKCIISEVPDHLFTPIASPEQNSQLSPRMVVNIMRVFYF